MPRHDESPLMPLWLRQGFECGKRGVGPELSVDVEPGIESFVEAGIDIVDEGERVGECFGLDFEGLEQDVAGFLSKSNGFAVDVEVLISVGHVSGDAEQVSFLMEVRQSFGIALVTEDGDGFGDSVEAIVSDGGDDAASGVFQA